MKVAFLLTLILCQCTSEKEGDDDSTTTTDFTTTNTETLPARSNTTAHHRRTHAANRTVPTKRVAVHDEHDHFHEQSERMRDILHAEGSPFGKESDILKASRPYVVVTISDAECYSSSTQSDFVVLLAAMNYDNSYAGWTAIKKDKFTYDSARTIWVFSGDLGRDQTVAELDDCFQENGYNCVPRADVVFIRFESEPDDPWAIDQISVDVYYQLGYGWENRFRVHFEHSVLLPCSAWIKHRATYQIGPRVGLPRKYWSNDDVIWRATSGSQTTSCCHLGSAHRGQHSSARGALVYIMANTFCCQDTEKPDEEDDTIPLGEDAIEVITKDGRRCRLPRVVLRMSRTLNTMISELAIETIGPIPLWKVDSVVLKKILKWCWFHRNDGPFVEYTGTLAEKPPLCEWDQRFFNMHQVMVYELILAANYLDIRGLLDSACRFVASMIAGKSPEEIRRMFNIKCDYTPEEEAKIMRENAWTRKCFMPHHHDAAKAADELAEYYKKIVRISDELDKERDEKRHAELYNPDGSAKVYTDIPPENVLKSVEYEEPSKGIEAETLNDVMRRLHSLTATEMRTILKQVHQSGQGTKKQLRARLRRYYRKEFSMYRMLHEGDSVPRLGNKTARHFDYLVAIDFECTCVEVIYDYPHEIIEFPAVLIDVRQMRIIDTFRSFVKPEKNPILDQFCVQLTGISQSTVDSAPTFRDAYRLFRDWMARHSLGDSGCRYAFVTDGPHDLWKFFQFQCILSNFGTIPHDCRHFINIKRIFEQRVMKLVKGNGQSGIQNMLSHYNLSFEGQKHCGLDDSINIARLCIKLMQDRIELRINQRMTRKQDRNEDRRLEELAKSDKADASDYHIWHRKLPLKLRQVTRDEFLSGEYLDCDSCDEVDE
ncbi:hypothetical protein Q1695_006753 [Nippostrongylus brasiliensis]|nr:hypothetical protein Q1695_006753 [Nippostrongylus brasiliensis]